MLIRATIRNATIIKREFESTFNVPIPVKIISRKKHEKFLKSCEYRFILLNLFMDYGFKFREIIELNLGVKNNQSIVRARRSHITKMRGDELYRIKYNAFSKQVENSAEKSNSQNQIPVIKTQTLHHVNNSTH